MSTPPEGRARLARARAARARPAGGAGLLLITSGIALWGAVFLVLVVLWRAGADLGNWPGAVGLPVTAVSLALVTRGRRMRVGAAEGLLAGDAAAPVVYLRPFGADGAEIVRRMSSRTRIPPSGRFVTTYEDWQARVGDLIGHASVVLLHTGEGTGLAWEVRRVIDYGTPGRGI
jgi:hypothetical protein